MEKWYWWYGNSEDFYANGPYETRDEAIAEGTDEYDEGEGFFVIEAVSSDFELSAEQIIEDQFFNNDEYAFLSQSGPERTAGADDADAELQRLLDYWVKKHRHTFRFETPFKKTRNQQFIAT